MVGEGVGGGLEVLFWVVSSALLRASSVLCDGRGTRPSATAKWVRVTRPARSCLKFPRDPLASRTSVLRLGLQVDQPVRILITSSRKANGLIEFTRRPPLGQLLNSVAGPSRKCRLFGRANALYYRGSWIAASQRIADLCRTWCYPTDPPLPRVALTSGVSPNMATDSRYNPRCFRDRGGQMLFSWIISKSLKHNL